MARKRCIAYGYDMQQGNIIVNEAESETIHKIFALYLAGKPMSAIAEILTRSGCRYREYADSWNKNMVHRILGNEQYLGDGNYPAIISEAEHRAVQQRMRKKRTYSNCPEIIRMIRKKTVCASCGAIMCRDTRSMGKARWKCQNEDCGVIVPLTDDRMTALVTMLLDKLSETSDDVTIPQPKAPEAGIETIRLRNELTGAFNRGTENGEYMRALILAVAAEEYNLLPDFTESHRVDMIRQRLESGERGESIRTALLSTAVQAIRIGDGTTVTLELVNGKEIASI